MTTALQKENIRVDFTDGQPVVSARDLWEALGIKTVFRVWFQRVCELGFAEGADYTKVYQKSYTSRTKQTEVDYDLSVDMAKHICMLQSNEKGKAYRQYFLELEKAWNSPEKVMARALQIARRQIEQLQEKCHMLIVQTQEQDRMIQEIKPKAQYLDNVLCSKSLVLATQIAKDYGMSGTKFNSLLAELGIQYKMRDQWLLYAPYQNQGYTASTTFLIKHSDGSVSSRSQTEWTQKGRRFLYLILKDNGILPTVERQLLEMTEQRRGGEGSNAGRSG